MIERFLLNIGFIAELLICTAIFSFSLKRRKLFVLRIILCLAALVLVSFIFGIFVEILWLQTLKILLIVAIMILSVYFCFDTTLWIALFCEIGAYATQHMGFKIGSTVQEQILLFTSMGNKMAQAVYVLIDGIIYVLSYMIFARKIRRNEADYIENKQIILLALALIMFTTLLQNIFDEFGENIPLAINYVILTYDFLCCIFTLCMQYGIFKSGRMLKDFKIMEHVLHLQKQQLETSRENIDIINIKCHDVKHQLSLLGDRISPDEMQELARVISIYDTTVKTGNEALDVVLAEKNLVCEREEFKMDCIVDGAKLGFMSSSDIYSLFGNAIDNAIEAVRRIENKDERIISILIKESRGMLSIHIENSYTGELIVNEGLPLTTKEDSNYHGFGMKSIRMLSEKYGGFFSYKVQNGIFAIDILFPVT